MFTFGKSMYRIERYERLFGVEVVSTHQNLDFFAHRGNSDSLVI